MKHNMSSLFAMALVGLALAAPAFAQAPGPGNPGGGFGGGQGGGQRRPPFAFGTVGSVDATAGTITVTGQNGGPDQVIKVNTDAQLVTQKTVTVADLQVGDTVAIQGVPTGITASSITAGDAPAGLPGAGGFGGFGGGRGGAGGAGGANGGGANANANQGFAYATGKIKALPTATDAHIAITLSPDADVYVKMADNAKISKYATVTLADIKAGDQIMARGQTDADGNLAASTVGVNMTMGGMPGFGGRGGGFGGGGFGGGGRRRGGGGNNAPGGGGGQGGNPPPPGQ